MMTYSPLRPDWFWSIIEVPEVEAIIGELTELFHSDVKKVQLNDFYTNISGTDIAATCPMLCAYLKSAGVFTILWRAIFSTSKKSAPAHVDTYNPSICQMALNFPLVDTVGSYLAFYSTSDPDLITADKINPKLSAASNFAVARKGTISEVARIENTLPILVNTSVLHHAIIQKETRVIASLRFTRALTPDEVLALGCIGEPFVQS